jgi:hypothetical protein
LIQTLRDIRGGGDGDGVDDRSVNPDMYSSHPPQNNIYNMQSAPSTPTSEWPPSSSASHLPSISDDDMNANIGAHPSNDNMYEYRESVEERIDAWRRQQQVSICVHIWSNIYSK